MFISNVVETKKGFSLCSNTNVTEYVNILADKIIFKIRRNALSSEEKRGQREMYVSC